MFRKNKCNCNKRGIRVTGWRTDEYFRYMPELDSKNEGWRKVLICEECGQYWLVDEFDRAQSLFGIKIDGLDDVGENKLLEIHKLMLIESHKGESGTSCQMVGCNSIAVNDFAFCATCLITKQGVYE